MAINWMERAKCRSADAELFFGPEDEHWAVQRQREADAIAICRACPVRVQCLTRAKRMGDDVSGVWGGLGEADVRRVVHGKAPRLHTGTEKACTGCQEVKPLGEYSVDPRRRDGRRSKCRGCVSEERRIERLAKREAA